jgi:hypothetical protein
MSKLITAKIDVLKISKELLFKGTKGTYLDLIIWQNDTPDQFGNDFSIQQRTKQGDPKIFLGEGKFYVKKEEVSEGSANKEAIVNKAKEQANNDDDLPF